MKVLVLYTKLESNYFIKCRLTKEHRLVSTTISNRVFLVSENNRIVNRKVEFCLLCDIIRSITYMI